MGSDALGEAIRERLTYNPDNGEFWWKPGIGKMVPNGARADHKHGRYMRIMVRVAGKAKDVLAHRAAFFMMTGRWPECVDHRNRDRYDNRWDNLREATRQQNSLNRVFQPDRELPIGVRRKWANYEASIYSNGTYKYLGTYPTAALASEAYQLEFNRRHGAEWNPNGQETTLTN